MVIDIEHFHELGLTIDDPVECAEPVELQALYEVALQRLEPVGLVYLWPTTRL